MDLTAQVVWAITLYKVVCLCVGTMFCVLGFKLFFGGLQPVAGNMVGEAGRFKLSLNTAAPGTFFAVLGAAIVIATIVQGLDFTLNSGTNGNPVPGNSISETAPFPKLP